MRAATSRSRGMQMSEAEEITTAEAELIDGFAAGTLDAARRREAQRLLETREACRARLRQLTAGRFPRLPNYTIIEQVGKGGFGIVYKAVHHAKERCEALKVLFSKTPLVTAYFENEVHLIARLRHPNIATLHEAQLSAPPFYYTMEFVEGVRLNEYLKANPVSLARRIELVKTIAAALSYAHEQGVVHRDIKPQNILIDGDGVPHIVDFGIAKKLGLASSYEGRGPGESAPVGTLGYIAPEQKAGERVDARADIYSLGALLYNCVTGQPARHAGETERTVRLLRKMKVGWPEDLAAIIARCVAEAPQDRYGNCKELVRDLDSFMLGRAVRARREPSPLRRAARSAAYVLRHYPNWVQAAAVALVAAFVPFMFWKLHARAIAGLSHADQVMVVGFSEKTEQALVEGRIGADIPGLTLADRKSLRMLHGQMIRTLSRAQPQVVVMDYFFPDCRDEYDEPLIEAIRAAAYPVVVGAADLDVNCEPQVCENLRRVIHSAGSIHNPVPVSSQRDAHVMLCIQRGFNPVAPGLAVAAFAAARHPGYRAQLQLNRDRRELQIRFERVKTLPGEARFLPSFVDLKLGLFDTIGADTAFPLSDDAPGESGDVTPPREPRVQGTNWWLKEGDQVAHARIQTRDNEYWRKRTLQYEDVLTASDNQLKLWFNGKAVILGETITGRDQHVLSDRVLFGCQIHAETLDSLLGNYFEFPFSFRDLSLRAVLWCALSAVLASIASRRLALDWAVVPVGCALVLLTAVAVGAQVALWSSNGLIVEAALAGCAMSCAFAVSVLVRAVRQRQMRFTPARVSLGAEDTTLPSTVLAEAGGTSMRA